MTYAIEADRTRIEERINVTRENYRMMREELLKVVYWRDGVILHSYQLPCSSARLRG